MKLSAKNRSASSPNKYPRNSRARRCSFRFADGRRCRLAPGANPLGLCRHHAARESGPGRPQQDVSRDLASLSGDFMTSTDVNHALGRLWRLFSRGRIPRRDAVTFAYIGQLLLQSVPNVRGEIREAAGHAGWTGVLRDVILAAANAGSAPRAANPASASARPPAPASRASAPAPGTFVATHDPNLRYDHDSEDDSEDQAESEDGGEGESEYGGEGDSELGAA